jgi:hypothetical protein
MKRVQTTLALMLLMIVQASAIDLRPEDFGAKIDDGKPDNEAFQLMFDAIPDLERQVNIILQSGEYVFESTVYYPKYSDRKTTIDGQNAYISADGLDFDLLTPKMSSSTSVGTALEQIDKLVIRDVTFVNGDTQLRLAATLNAEINNCSFIGANRGIDMVFCLMGRVINCQFTRHKVEQLLVRSGQGDAVTGESKSFTNATGQNSQSNMVTVDGCRFFSEEGAHACIRNYASNSMNITNTVFEGLSPKYAVDYDDRNSTTCTYFYMHNIHIELPMNPNTKALIKAKQNGGVVHLDGIYSQTGRTVQVEGGRSIMKLTNWAYLPGGFLFKANGVGEWMFEDNKGLEGIDMNSVWVEDPPAYISVEYGPNISSYAGYSPTLRSGDEFLSVTGDRLTMTTSSFLNKDQSINQLPKDIGLFEVKDLQPYIVINPETGIQETWYIPVFGYKVGEEEVGVRSD